MDFLFLLIGLALVVKGGDFFVQSAVAIAERLRVPRVVVGGTLMSLATTTPEVVVSVVSGLRGASGLALGNAAGSVICNIALIGGTMAVVGHVGSKRHEVLFPALAMCAAGLVALGGALDLNLGRPECLLLLVLGFGYFIGDFARHMGRRVPHEEAPDDAPAGEASAGISLARAFGIFAVGAIMVVGGSRLLVDAAVRIATQFGIPENIIGVTIVAVGTSLPELVSAITSARRGVSDLAVGNIIGANIANVTLVMGTAGVLAPIGLTRAGLELNIPPMLAAMALFSWLVVARGGVSRNWGRGLLVLYGVYLLWVVQLVLGGRLA